ncbi:hypothetical protein GIB67_007196 [Kingdonia uniflora]|uniref:DNA helicase n=1 Tax=Kingdonia uniflora TaxID=39325 RepID=A0A7J7ND94_9MAGN|nr:hypothetical protein GIB67_007196 [Kingdonia uniflora]
MVLSGIEKMVSVIGMIICCSLLIPEIKEAVFQCLVRGYFSDPINIDRGQVNEPKRCGRQECLAMNSMTLIHNRSRLDSDQGTSIMVNKASLRTRELEVNQLSSLSFQNWKIATPPLIINHRGLPVSSLSTLVVVFDLRVNNLVNLVQNVLGFDVHKEEAGEGT